MKNEIINYIKEGGLLRRKKTIVYFRVLKTKVPKVWGDFIEALIRIETTMDLIEYTYLHLKRVDYYVVQDLITNIVNMGYSLKNVSTLYGLNEDQINKLVNSIVEDDRIQRLDSTSPEDILHRIENLYRSMILPIENSIITEFPNIESIITKNLLNSITGEMIEKKEIKSPPNPFVRSR